LPLGEQKNLALEQEPRGFSLAGKVTNFEVYGADYMDIEFCQVNCGG
jgi:hypothetical protein